MLLRVDPKFLQMDLRSLMEERALLEQETGDLLDELCGIHNDTEEGNPAVEETVTSLLQARASPIRPTRAPTPSRATEFRMRYTQVTQCALSSAATQQSGDYPSHRNYYSRSCSRRGS